MINNNTTVGIPRNNEIYKASTPSIIKLLFTRIRAINKPIKIAIKIDTTAINNVAGKYEIILGKTEIKYTKSKLIYNPLGKIKKYPIKNREVEPPNSYLSDAVISSP